MCKGPPVPALRCLGEADAPWRMLTLSSACVRACAMLCVWSGFWLLSRDVSTMGLEEPDGPGP